MGELAILQAKLLALETAVMDVMVVASGLDPKIRQLLLARLTEGVSTLEEMEEPEAARELETFVRSFREES